MGGLCKTEYDDLDDISLLFTIMKKLNCPECRSYDLMPPSAERSRWLCNSCLTDFKVGRKDAKKILERADKKSIDLGEYRPYLHQAAQKQAKQKARRHHA
jgi:transposase-like protein